MAWTFFTVLKSNHIIHQVLTESAPQRLFLRMSNRSGFFRLPCSFLGNMRKNPTLPREVTMHEIPSIECMQCNAVGPIRSNFAARLPSRRPIEIPLNFILLLWRISSPPSLALLAPSSSFLRVLARRVIVPYLAAAGRRRSYLLPFPSLFEKKSYAAFSISLLS